ncbi:hypothetical protein An04g01220 [Aspergillus niger]|uniref:Uncharacterized protein n=2 Tax=Aspergillus niger TaxID=5061 RepID=A2QHV9_ASPNC|nr:hypothetical protein An04g01220 [Aspergillus niger]CAK38579.1 hypothetical protein An04g01220 [Aspergillus niger]
MKLAWGECAYGQTALDSGWPRRESLNILSSRPISIAVCTSTRSTLWPGQVGATKSGPQLSAVFYTHTCQEAKATPRHLGDRNSNANRALHTNRPDSLGVVEIDTSILRRTSLAMRDWGLAPPSGRMLNLSVLLPATTNVRDVSSRIPSEESPSKIRSKIACGRDDCLESDFKLPHRLEHRTQALEAYAWYEWSGLTERPGEEREEGGRKRSQRAGRTNQQTHEQEVGHWRGVTGWSRLNQMDRPFVSRTKIRIPRFLFPLSVTVGQSPLEVN